MGDARRDVQVVKTYEVVVSFRGRKTYRVDADNPAEAACLGRRAHEANERPFTTLEDEIEVDEKPEEVNE